MRKTLTSAAVIVAAGAMVVAGGALSVFNDQGEATGTHQTGTVELQVNDGTANQTLALSGPCVQPFRSLGGPLNHLNLGTVNNAGCNSTLRVSNVGSLPFELSSSTLSDTNPAGLTCFASTYTAGTDRDAVLAPGTSQVVTVATNLVNDDKGCQGLTNPVTATLVANEAELPLTNGSFEAGLDGWTPSPAPGGSVTTVTSYEGFSAAEGSRFALLISGQVEVYSMVSQPFSASSGSVISGRAFFKAQDSVYWNDSGDVVVLDDANNVVATVFSASVSTVGDYGSTPWTAWSFTVTTPGDYRIAARVKNFGDSIASSALGLDSVHLS